MSSKLSVLFGLSDKEEQIVKSLMSDLDKLGKNIQKLKS